MLINYILSASLFIIHTIYIFNIIEKINIEIEKKSTKILILTLLFIISGIIIAVNLLIGLIAKNSLLIICGCKNENVCLERRVKFQGNKTKDNYAYFKDENDYNVINSNLFKRFHACIYSNKI